MTALIDDSPREARPFDPVDRDVVADCLARASRPSEGNWSAWATLAWIASGGNEKFVHAVQLYEVEQCADRLAFWAWLALGNAAGEAFGCTFSDAEKLLREKVEANKLPAGIAYDLRIRESVEVPRPRWNDWQRTFDQPEGLSFIPGYRDFKWSAAAVQAAFPPMPTEAARSAAPPVDLAAWGDDAVERGVTVKEARADARDKLGASAPPADACRAALKQARDRRGIPTKRGRPVGAKSFAKR